MNVDHIETRVADQCDRADQETAFAVDTRIAEIRAQAQKLDVQPILKEEKDDRGNIVHAYSICLHCEEPIPYGERWCRHDKSQGSTSCLSAWEAEEKERKMRMFRD